MLHSDFQLQIKNGGKDEQEVSAESTVHGESGCSSTHAPTTRLCHRLSACTNSSAKARPEPCCPCFKWDRSIDHDSPECGSPNVCAEPTAAAESISHTSCASVARVIAARVSALAAAGTQFLRELRQRERRTHCSLNAAASTARRQLSVRGHQQQRP